MKKNEFKPSNIENLDVTHFVPLKNLISHTWSFYKVFHIACCDKYVSSVFYLLYFINSSISRERLPHLPL